MGNRKYNLTIPLPIEISFNLLVEAGSQLPASSELAGIKFGRWENTSKDLDTGYLEWKMYDHKYASIILRVNLIRADEEETEAIFEVDRKGQYLDPMGLYKKTLRLLLDPFLDLVKANMTGNLE